MLRYVLLLLAWAAAAVGGLAQPDGLYDPSRTYYDLVNDDRYRTVQLYRGNWELNFPVLYVGETDAALQLEFDRMGSTVVDLAVALVHCNTDWRPSNLLPVEYYTGLPFDRIYNPEPSRLTQTDYIHYRYSFPQNGAQMKASGNYVLVVYDEETEEVVLTRRFVVAENQFEIAVDVGLTPTTGRRFTAQAVNFSIYPKQVTVPDPMTNLATVVLQNNNWNTARIFERPTYLYPGRYEYRFDQTNDFPGGNEFRLIDLRSLQLNPSPRMTGFVFSAENTLVLLDVEQTRTKNRYTTNDLNGAYYIDVTEFNEADLESDYLTVRFRVKVPERIPKGDVYLYGQFTDWRLQPRFRLTYDAGIPGYYGDVLLKQGIYDYKYVVKTPDGGLDETVIEGSHFDVENQYTLLSYFRGPTDRYDRLMAFRYVNFLER